MPRPGPAIGNIEQTTFDAPAAGLAREAAARRELTRWGWVDRRRGIARIPIDRAMRIVVERSAGAQAAALPGGRP